MSSQNIYSIVRLLGKKEVVLLSGFAVGFFYYVGFNKRTLRRPLSTMFDGAISGFFCSLGAGIVTMFLPPAYWFIVSLGCGISIAGEQLNMLSGNRLLGDDTMDKKN